MSSPASKPASAAQRFSLVGVAETVVGGALLVGVLSGLVKLLGIVSDIHPLLLLLAAFGVSGFTSIVLWGPHARGGERENQRLRQQVADHEERLVALESRAGAPGADVGVAPKPVIKAPALTAGWRCWLGGQGREWSSVPR